MQVFRDFSIFRLRVVIPALTGIYTISAHAYNSACFFTDPHILKKFVMGEFSLMLLLFAGFLMNDICDVKHDMVNRPDTVYIGRSLSPLFASFVVALLFSGSIALALAVNMNFLFVIIGQTAGLVFYNLYSKGISWGKPLLVSLLLVSIYPFSFALTEGGIASPRRDSLFIFPVWLFLSVIAYELLADAADAEGDGHGRDGGYAARIGSHNLRFSGKIVAGISAPVAFIPYFAGMCHGIYLAGAAVSALILYSAYFRRGADFFLAIHFYIVGIIIASIADIVVMP